MVVAVIISAGAVIGCSSKGNGAIQTSSGVDNGASGTVASTTGSNSGSSAGGSAAGNNGSSGGGSGAVGSGTVSGSSGVSGPTSGSTTPSGSSGVGGLEGGSDATFGSGDDGSEGQGDSGLAEAFDAAGRTPPTCAKPTPPPNDVGGAQGSRPSECDYLLQSLDFEDMYSYPSTTAVKVSGAFGLSQVNNCSPYCYAQNLTVGIDITPDQLQGDIIVEFPATGPGLPITTVDATQMNTRDALAWITFDGAAAPAFEIDTQLIVETGGSVIVPAVEVKEFFKTKNLSPFGPFSVANNYSYGNGCEFKYFPFTSTNGFPNALTNVTGMGFRIVAKPAAGQSWHGVAYIDHMHVRLPSAADMPTGNYPFGLQ